MSQYKVLPSYSEINTLNHEYEETSHFANFSLIYSHHTSTLQDIGSRGTDEPPRPSVEYQEPMQERVPFFPWEQEGVVQLQQVLNSQPPVTDQDSTVVPVIPYTSVWGLGEEEGQESLDLSTTSTIPPYTPHSSLTILHHRDDGVVSHHREGGEVAHHRDGRVVSHHREGGVVSHHREGGVVAHHSIEDTPVTSYRDTDTERRYRLHSRDSVCEGDRLCKVCGEKAGKHSYYGGQACPSCRAFFRRSVQSGYNATYFCVKEGQCQVTLKTRKNCQACRYKLCEAAGMKTTWVLTEEERKIKFDGKGKKRRASSVGQSDHNCLKIKTDDNAHLSEDDIADISNYVAASDYWEISKVNDMNTELIRKIIRMIAFRAALDQAGQAQLQEVMINRVKKFATKIAEYHSLSHHDKDQILSHNVPLVVILSTCSMFSTKMPWTTQLTPILGAEEVEKLNTKLRTLSVSGLDSLSMTYTQFFRTQEGEEEGRVATLVEDIGCWQQEPTELILLSLVILFCPDMMDLVDRKKVEEIQLKFAVLLQSYLNHKYPTDLCLARNKFTKGMLVINKCNEMVMLGIKNVE